MAKEAYYFSHDANARQDEKILMLRAEHGWEGYGIYWALVEMMFESSDTALHHNKIKGIAVSYNIDITLLQSVINTCLTEELFTGDDDKFWSDSLKRRKTKYHEAKSKKSEAGKKGMAKRWGETKNDNTVITENNKGKESKGNIKPIVDSDECDETFNQFWDVYPKKQGKAKAVVKWRSYFKTGKINMVVIMTGLESYLKYVEHERTVRKFDRQYLDGLTFINGERWNDDWTIKQSFNPRNTTSTLETVELSQERIDFLADVERKQRERNKIAGTIRGTARDIDIVS